MPTILRNGVPTYISVEKYNEELAKRRKEVLGVNESTSRLESYNVEDLGKIWINGQEFSGMSYQGFSTVNTKTYVEEPSRANDGSIPNINDYDTFVVPRCKINFKYLNIKDYQRLCEAVQSNEFLVSYYDKQFIDPKTGTLLKVEHKMYCEPEEMAKLYNVGTDVFGVLDYEVSFIGTLNDLETFTVTYDGNGGSSVQTPELYDSLKGYKKGDIVYLEDSNKNRRYFQAIYYINSFKGIDLTNESYWKPHSVSQYSVETEYQKDNIVYEVKTNEDNKTSYTFYIAVYNGKFTNQPLTDTYYWKPINATKYNNSKTYSSNKISSSDTTNLGNFVYQDVLPTNIIYEAIYYVDTFSGQHPTNTTYWASITNEGVSVKWGQSIVIADPLQLFNKPQDFSSAKEWNTSPNGTGYTYKVGQSLNVYKNMTLYAIWE